MRSGKSFFGGRSMKSIRFATLCVGLGLSSFSFMDHAQAAPASDNAANYTGTVSWTNGSTAGTGFGLWTFTNNHNGTNTWAGTYLADASNPTNSRNSAIFSTNASGKAFALYANPGGAFMVAKRNFGVSNAVPLAVGETFSFKWLQFWSGGDKGINLFQGGDGDAEKVLNLRQLQDATGNKFVVQPKNFSNSPTAITDAYNDVVTVNLRCAAPDTLVLTVQTGDPADGTYTNTFRAPAPDRVSFYFSNGSNGSNDEPLFNDLAITTNSVATRQVKFSVDMGNFEGATPKRFDPASGDKVYVRGWPVGGWGSEGLVQLFRQTGTTVFTNTVSVPGDVGLSSGGYKFFIEKGSGSSTVVDNNGYEIISEREFNLPSGNTNLPIAAFDNQRQVNFAVDMGAQIFKGLFDPTTNGVEVRGEINGTGFNTGFPLVRQGTSSIYTNTIAINGSNGASLNYKFFGNGTNALTWEVLTVPNRSLTLTSSNQILPTNSFSELAESRKITFRVNMSAQQQLGNFNPSTGTVKVAGSFGGNPTNWSVVNLAAQGSGVYAAEVPVDGSLSGFAYKFMNGETYETIENRTIAVALPNLAPSTLDPIYFNNVSPTGSTFTGAYAGQALTNVAPNGLTYLMNYAFGGSDTNTPKLPVLDNGNTNNLTLVAFVRTNHGVGTLEVKGEKADLLGNWDTNNLIPGDPAPDQTGAPEGTQKQIFSTPRSGDRQFLRLRATLAP